LASLRYGYGEDRYPISDDEYEDGPRSASRMSPGFLADDNRTLMFTPTLSSKPKRRLSLRHEEDAVWGDHGLQSKNFGDTYKTHAPPSKKRRLEAERTRSFTSIAFSATQPASLRRALSLRSADDGDELVAIPKVRPLLSSI
jgi:hypothetical protein